MIGTDCYMTAYASTLHIMYVQVICNYIHEVIHSIFTHECAFFFRNPSSEGKFFFVGHMCIWSFSFAFFSFYVPEIMGERGENALLGIRCCIQMSWSLF